MVQEASGMDLAESFLRGVVSKLLEPSAGDRIFQIIAMPERNFSLGSLVEILEIEAAPPRGFEREDDAVLHAVSSKCSRTRSSLAAIC